MATAFTTCPLCEATCGLEVTVADGAVARIRGDADDVLSHGFVCPKGASLRELHDDPDRLRTPLLREPGGGLRPASWDEAFAAALAEREVAMSHFSATRMRAVTHLDVDDDGIDRAPAAAAQALQ